MKTVVGRATDAASRRFGIVVSLFNPRITLALLDGAVATLKRYGVTEDQIEVYKVPGAFEVPLACHWAAGRADAVIALSCIIRGGTPHFDIVANEVANGCTRVALDTGKPIAFGVLTCDDLDQAVARSEGTEVPSQGKPGAGVDGGAPLHGNKGSEAAVAAMEMLSIGMQVN
jgi:6,7-dimethyl-8-ribityllumazine synthase